MVTIEDSDKTTFIALKNGKVLYPLTHDIQKVKYLTRYHANISRTHWGSGSMSASACCSLVQHLTQIRPTTAGMRAARDWRMNQILILRKFVFLLKFYKLYFSVTITHLLVDKNGVRRREEKPSINTASGTIKG